MRMARVAVIVIVSSAIPISKAPIRQISLEQRALRRVLIIDDPAPSPTQQVQSPIWLSGSNVRAKLEGRYEWGDVFWELGRHSADRSPVSGEAGGYGNHAVSTAGGVEEEGEGIGVLRVKGCVCVVVAEGAVGGVEGLGVDGDFESFGLFGPGGGEGDI